MMPMKKINKGMTLLEVLIVVTIIGILAGLGFVNYAGIREHSLGREAQANLKLIAAAERIYRMEYGHYYGSDASISNINDVLKLSMPGAANRSWDYAITSAGDDAFAIRAQRLGAGGALDCEYTQQQDQDEPQPNADCR